MKLRFLAMATVAAVALSSPALAADGWYLGLGGGYDSQNHINAFSVPQPGASVRTGDSDGGIGNVAFGYAWNGGWHDGTFRVEDEIAYTEHTPAVAGANLYNSVLTDMVNVAYDIPPGTASSSPSVAASASVRTASMP